MPLKAFYVNQPLRPDLISTDINSADFIYCDVYHLAEPHLATKPILLNLNDPQVTLELLNSNQYFWIDHQTLDPEKINQLQSIAQQMKSDSLDHQRLNQSIKELEYQIQIKQQDLLSLQERKKINRFESINLQQQYHFFYDFIKEIEDTETLTELLAKLAKFFQRHTGISHCGLIKYQNQQSTLLSPYNNKVHTLPRHLTLQEYHVDDLYFYENRLPEVTQLINPAIEFIHLMPLQVSAHDSIFFVLSGELKVDTHYNWLLNLQSLLRTKLQSLNLLQDIKKNSLIWKSAFNQLGLAVAVVDENHNIVLSNTHYQLDLHQTLVQQNQLSQLQGEVSYQEQLYHFEILDIILPNQKNFKFIIMDNIRQEREQFNQFLQKQKLELMARLSDRIAHDLLNPIGGIQSLTELLISEPISPTQTLYQDDLKQIQFATQRAIDIIRSLQDFTKPQCLDHSPIDIGEEIKRTLVFAKSLTRYVSVKLSLPDSSLFVKVQKDLMQQIIFNLIQNAVHAMNNQGQLIINVTQNSATVDILFQDSGPGIPTHLRDTVFAPLFTTKKLGQGTGLGLAFVKGVIEQWSGSISLVNPLPNFTGACFVITLPLSLKGSDEN